MPNIVNSTPRIALTAAQNTDHVSNNPHIHLSTQRKKSSIPTDFMNPRMGRSSSTGLNLTHHFNRSPVRSPDSHRYTTQRLRNPSFSNSQRRSSTNGLADVKDVSWSSISSNATNFSNPSTSSIKTPVYPSATSRSSRGSPRSSLADYTYSSPNLPGARRNSDLLPRKPSTAEIFDLMEREQDAIVLKLIKEIAQLKEENRALVNTINQLSNNPYATRSRNNSSAFRDHPDHPDHLDISNTHSPDPKSNKTHLC